MIDDRLYWPVAIDDKSHWSDEDTVYMENYPFRETKMLTYWLNGQYYLRKQRVVPGSIENLGSSGIKVMVSNALWRVNKIEHLAAAELKDSSGIWHERYQLCNAQSIGDKDSEIVFHLLQGAPKPWNVPIGYVRDGENIVLIRSKVVEEYLKRHLTMLFYENCRLMAEIDGNIRSITEHAGNHPTKTTQHEQPT